MVSYGLSFVLVVLVVQKCAVYVQGQIKKSSLTFVIDDTASMWDEINQVKQEVNIIFEKVLSSKASQIENFIIVTFNDPGAKLRTITKDRNEFKNALASIHVHSLPSNTHCPEEAMTGIELGLTSSLPLSYIYVFTDAKARDYYKFKQIKSISQKKQSQVVFLLTGDCHKPYGPDYEVYHQVAEATGGQVFSMVKDDVKDILKYIEESITGRGVAIVNKKYPPGSHQVKFTVDAHTGDVLISLTGLGSRIGEVTGPGGIKPPAEPIVSGREKIAVKRLSNLKPGDYEVEIEGKGEVHIIMIAKSDINFQLGFSIDSPTSIKDTVTRPPPEGNTFLGARLLGEGVELTSVRITDLDNNVIEELPLKIVDKKEQFYITPSFHSPTTMFLVTVIGKDLKTGTSVIRTGPTPIARQDPTAEPAVNTALEVTIQGAPKIITEHDATLTLKCNVHGYPAPNIIWSEKDTGIMMPAKVQTVEVPYDYVSSLEIKKTNLNVTYECKASNSIGKTSKYVEVERKPYFDVIEAPKDIRVEYTKEGSIVCKIDAYPPATVTWYKDGAVFVGNTNVDVSSDKSTLTIKSMQPELKGKYSCEARSDIDRKVFIVDVDIFGVEKPVIDKSHGEQRAPEKTNTELSCRTLKGIPKPAISWSFKPAGTTSFIEMTVTTETVQLKEVRQDQTGTYQCRARNDLGSDSFTMELIVEYPPAIKANEKVKKIKNGEKVRIPCDVTGEPSPTVQWFFKGILLDSSSKILISSDHSIEFIATPSDIGDYTCEAKNKLDTAKITVSLDVLEAPVIDKSPKEKRVRETTNDELSCRILRGNPKPAISWSFKPAGTTSFIEMTETTETVQLKEVRQDQTGTYQCRARNDLGSDSFTMELIVEYPPTIKVENKTKQIKNGDKVRIPCDVTGEPSPTVQWFFKGILLDSSSKILISSDHSIEFIATPSDIGDYTCEAKNKLDTAKITVSLDVQEAPVIDKSPKEKRVREKTNDELSCRILRGNPKPTISWSFKPAGTTSFIEMTETTETVQLKEVRQDQTGTYQCRARNDLGSDSFTMELIVEYPPTIKVDEKTKKIKNGDKVRIPCDVTGEPSPTVQWFFKGILLDSSSKIIISSDNSIEFIATPSDIGDYTCEAKNKLDTAKITVSLDVLEVPVIDKTTKEKRVREKTNCALSCRILRGNPKPSISWSFKPVGKATFKAMKDTTEIVNLKKVRKDQTGTYECKAVNTQGSDSYTIELIVEYPPAIKKDVKLKQIKDDDEVTISCDVTGEPVPTVTWFFNGARFDSAARSRETSDHSLRFKARIADIGSYRCEATNKLGSATKTTKLKVYVPVSIETPKNSIIEQMVGKSYILECRADGYPKPNIKWSFQSSDPKIPAKDVTPTGDAASLVLKNLQLNQQGLYTCEAENGIGGSDSITYDVKVYAPPAIVNKYPFKNFEVVIGDVALRIQCNATGSPKPSIVWMKNGFNVATGSEWYDMEDDGTLIIKNIDRESEGTYVCRAKNILGQVTELYEVTVREYSVPLVPTFTIHVKEGETVKVDCGLPHSKTDQMRWYKDSLVVASGELTLYSVTRSDDGLYTCRVSNPAKSRSVTTKVVVGFKPEFSTIEADTVDFFNGAGAVILSCEAIGQPKPTTAIWKHNGKTLGFTDMSFPLGMVYGATGMYECEVSNAFGSIRRTFNVTSRDCILDIKEDFPKKKQPLMVSRALTWPVYPVSDGYMIIPNADFFYMVCPSKFSNPVLPPYNFTAFCEGDNKIKINGNLYNFADIQCNEEVEPEASKTGIACLPGNTEYVKIGFKIFDDFLGVFDVCLDKENNVPLFTKHKLSPDHTDRSTEAPWSNIQLPQDFSSLYDCSRQMYDITSTLRRGLSTRESCCFGKRQLVNSHDLAPGIPPSSAFDYLNVIPHWSTCSSKNWEDVEQSVRKLAKSTGRNLVISTGTATPLHGVASTVITLHDSRGGKQAVAPYLWKVVQDPVQAASLAIIQINIPELTAAEATKHVRCPNYCGGDGINWLKPSNWQTVEDGYTYCCSIIDFENAFGYSGRFSPGMNELLMDGTL